MAKDILMPHLGADMSEGKLIRWLKSEGEAIAEGDAIVEIETDKVNIEVEAEESGVLSQILAQAGEMIAVGTPIAVLE